MTAHNPALKPTAESRGGFASRGMQYIVLGKGTKSFGAAVAVAETENEVLLLIKGAIEMHLGNLHSRGAAVVGLISK